MDEFIAHAEVQTALAQARALTSSGDYKEAAEAFLEVRERDPDGIISATDLNSLCWRGATNNFAEDVLAICDWAVELSPDHGGIRDSRGVARALTGDAEGALEDFKAFIEWGQGYNVDWREAWIDALEAGTDPLEIFDEEMLEALRNE